jgi:ribosomal protein S18 acetylase RimI-like enzyme
MLKLITPRTPQKLDETRSLFMEYASGLGVDLCFQDFEHELRELPGKYKEPHGVLLLAVYDSMVAGCCALRPLTVPAHPHAAEMKRLYVRPAFRGKGIAYGLVTQVLKKARESGYSCVLLDTLKTMEAAQLLYKRLGFQEILPYYDNPIEGAKYLKLEL